MLSVYPSNGAAVVEAETGFDVIDELRLRTLARKRYISEEDRNPQWNPVLLDEMQRMDEERTDLN